MKNTTGLTRGDIQILCRLIRDQIPSTGWTWPPVLGLYRSVVVTLTYLRRNRIQAEIAEAFDVSQPTISRAICTLTPMIETVLRECVPTSEDLDENVPYLVDGTLVPCWSWKDHPELYSGKHKTTGMNLQIAAGLTGELAWVSDAAPG